jgi:hypothetical protein
MMGDPTSAGGELSRSSGSCGVVTSAGGEGSSSSARGNTISLSLKSVSEGAGGANILLAGGLVLLVLSAHHDPQRIIRQRPLQRLGLIPRRAHPDVALFVVVRITGIALGWIGSTTAFGAVVRKP